MSQIFRRTLPTLLLLLVAACGDSTGPAGPVSTVQITAASPSIYRFQSYQLTFTARDARGRVATGKTAQWSSSNVEIASVSESGLLTAHAIGTATITGTVDGVQGTLEVNVLGVPEITSVGSGSLTVGDTVTIVGAAFPVSNGLVQLGGRTAVITSSSSTSIDFVVPCVQSGTAPLHVSAGEARSAAFNVTVSAPRHTLAVGETMMFNSSAAATCNEFTGPVSALFAAVVYNVSTSIASRPPVQILGNAPLGPIASTVAEVLHGDAGRVASPSGEPVSRADRAHMAQLEGALRTLDWNRTATAARADVQATASSRVPPALGEMRNFFFTYPDRCTTTNEVIRAKAVVVRGRVVFWEDETNILQSATNAALLGYYQRLARIYDEEQHDLIVQNFADPLLRDAEFSNEGVVHVILSRRVNSTDLSGFASACDQLPRSQAPGSNRLAAVYASVPTVSGTSPTNSDYPDGWFALQSVALMHQVKHLASFSARAVKGAAAEQVWLEEGTARIAEELWSRQQLAGGGWKQNMGWGSVTTAGVWCDFHLNDELCIARDPLRRPSIGTRRHLNNLLPRYQVPWDYSPYGDVDGQVGFTFVNTSWSLVRYTVDRFATDESTFLRALTNASTTGMANLTSVANASAEEIVGGWGLAQFADDYPGLAAPQPGMSFPSWNLRSIYGGLHGDPSWMNRYADPFPIEPLTFPDAIFTTNVFRVRGGGHLYLQFSGRGNNVQLINLQAAGVAVLDDNVRLAIVRLK